MNAFTATLNQVFTTLALFFTVIERLFKTADNLARVAEESSGAFHDEAHINRQIKLDQLKKDREHFSAP